MSTKDKIEREIQIWNKFLDSDPSNSANVTTGDPKSEYYGNVLIYQSNL
jgi:hypothetical protein